MKCFTILIAILAAVYVGCGDDTTGPQYTVSDELFFQKDYDSVWFGIIPADYYEPLKIRKIKVSFEYFTNRTDSNYIRISAGYYPYNWFDTFHLSGLYNIEHLFPVTQDSTLAGVYRLHVNTANSYIVVRNFKAYRSY